MADNHSRSVSAHGSDRSGYARKSRVICLSHKEDVDGLASSILITVAYKSAISVMLVDYANIISKVKLNLSN